MLDRYRERDEEAIRLEEELRAADERIAELENRFDADETRVESSGPETLGEELDASNDPEAPGQGASSDAAEDEPAEEASFSDFVDELGTDDETSVAEQFRDDGPDDEYFEAEAVEADEEIDDAESSAIETDEDIDDEQEPSALGADEDIDGDEFEPVAVESDEPVDSDDIEAAGEADGISDSDAPKETESGDEDAFPVTEADDEDDWTSATSAEITRLEDHASGAGRDDLKLIKGIGPAIEKTLNELGIFRYDQIADMSEYDIERVARRLRGFRSRIYREDWIGQARDLQLQKTAN